VHAPLATRYARFLEQSSALAGSQPDVPSVPDQDGPINHRRVTPVPRVPDSRVFFFFSCSFRPLVDDCLLRGSSTDKQITTSLQLSIDHLSWITEEPRHHMQMYSGYNAYFYSNRARSPSARFENRLYVSSKVPSSPTHIL
jgi:hypothetical protein